MNRSIRLLPPLLAVATSVVWLAWSVVHLVGSATTYHLRVVAPPAGAVPATAAEAARLLVEQNRLGDHVMFAVAAVAVSLAATLVVWLLGMRRRPADRR